MIIVIVEKKAKKDEIASSSTEDWYEKQKNTIDLIIKSEDGKYEIFFSLDQNTSVEVLRNSIF